jgi:alpha-ketoglutarate-dependent taurine dioxygenase
VLTHVTLDPARLDDTALAVRRAWRESLVVVTRPAAPVPDVRATYDALLPKIGTPHYLAEDVRAGDRSVQRTGELWMEVRYDPAFPDAYRHSPNAQPLHTDGSYIPAFPNATLMCCVANADRGGETVFITAEALVEALRRERPELLAELEAVTMPHARSGDRRALPVIRRGAEGELRLNWNYYCVAADCGPEAAALRERFFAYLQGSEAVRAALVPVKLAPGDGVVWKDERVLHGRNAFVAAAAGERFLWKCAVDVDVFGGGGGSGGGGGGGGDRDDDRSDARGGE